jgi:hypothetical protein
MQEEAHPELAEGVEPPEGQVLILKVLQDSAHLRASITPAAHLQPPGEQPRGMHAAALP